MTKKSFFRTFWKPAIQWFCIALGFFQMGEAFALEADVSVSRFQTPEKSYTEVFIYILGSSVTAVPIDSVQHASVNVVYFINKEGNVIAGDHYNLVSSGVHAIADFMDLRRHFLNPGSYSITVELTDNYDTTNSVTLSRELVIEPLQNTLAQSDILLLGHIEPAAEEGVWVRGSWRLTPLPYAWYHADLNNLYFYHELYRTDITFGEDFYIRYAVVPQSDPEKVLLQAFKRMKPKSVNTIIQTIDITGLGSGEYMLQVGVYDQEKNQRSVAEKSFTRSNPEADEQWVESSGSFFEQSFTQQMDADSLRYALKSIAPKVSQIQTPVLNYLIEKGALENQRRFLHQYWVETNPVAPEQAYQEYMKLAVAVDQQYHSAFGYGFETDRGHIMLKYGFPDDIIAVDDEPSAPPYEIWFYHQFPATHQTNVRFLFYNASLAGGDYKLLHSTATGEVQNPRWQMILYSDAISETEGGDFIDARDVRDNFHRRAVEYFED